MDSFQEYFSIELSPDHLSASISCHKDYSGEQLDAEHLVKFLYEQQIRHGLISEAVERVAGGLEREAFPIVIAEATMPEDGTDALVTYEFADSNERIAASEEYDFREIMRIPAVEKGDRLATVTKETAGRDGINVVGDSIPAYQGKPLSILPGKNTVFQESDSSFYAQTEGQATVHDGKIHVHAVYEIYESVSMKTGNISFAGSLVIHGDVPSGYRVRAKGDIKIFGIAEAADITAGGSIFIEEGLAGMKKGIIRAGKDVHIGYINQGTVLAAHNIIAEQSILHSRCIAGDRIISRKGHIIGGQLAAGLAVEAQEVGNRLNTKTEISFGMNEAYETEMAQLQKKKQAHLESRDRFLDLGRQIENRDYENNTKLRIALLRQRHKTKELEEEIRQIDLELAQLDAFAGREQGALLKVDGTLYPNVTVNFGKYRNRVDKDHVKVKMELDHNEIYLRPLYEQNK